MPAIGLVSCRVLPEPDPDQGLLLDAARARGLHAELLAWDDPGADPGRFDIAVLRSCWNYYEDPDRFLAWIGRAARATRLFNPEPVVRWNLHKRYLDELGARDVPVVPTAWCDRGKPVDLGGLMRERGWDRVIVKPAISASSWRTRRFSVAEISDGQAFLDDLVDSRDAMIQPWLQGIERDGERSVVWIAGQVTHAVTKRLRLAEADEQLAGSPPVTDLERSIAEQAIRGSGLPTGDLLYGRVDLLPDGAGGLLVSECELMEPSLYFRESPVALARFLDAIEATLRGSPGGE